MVKTRSSGLFEWCGAVSVGPSGSEQWTDLVCGFVLVRGLGRVCILDSLVL